jgi:hypothetical protein
MVTGFLIVADTCPPVGTEISAASSKFDHALTILEAL